MRITIQIRVFQTGQTCELLAPLIESVEKIFEKRFTITRMAKDYVRIYRRMVDRRMKDLDRCIESSRRGISAPQMSFAKF